MAAAASVLVKSSYLPGRLKSVLFLGLPLLLSNACAWSQSVAIGRVAPNPALPGQTVSVGLETSFANGGVSGCTLTLTAQGQTTPLSSYSVPPPYTQIISLPTSISPGPYVLQDTCKNSSGQPVSSSPVTLNVTLGPPKITSLSPGQVTYGTNNTISITGSGFGQTQGQGYIHFIAGSPAQQLNGAINVPDLYVSSISSWSNTQISFTLPAYTSIGVYGLLLHTDSNGDVSSSIASCGANCQTSALIVVPPAPPAPPDPIQLTALPANNPLVSMFVAGPCVVSQSGVNIATDYSFNTNFWDGIGNGCANHVQHLLFNQGLPQETFTDQAGNSYTFPLVTVPGPAISIPIQLQFVDQSNLHPFQAGMYQGDHGHFEATVQQWVPGDPAGLSPPGGVGQWQPYNNPALQQSLRWNVSSTGSGQTNTQTEWINLTLPSVNTFLRLGVYYNESDSRVSKYLDVPEYGSNNGAQPPWNGYYENPGCLTVQLQAPLSCPGPYPFTSTAAPNSSYPTVLNCDAATGAGPVAGLCLGTGPSHVSDSGIFVIDVNKNDQITQLPPTNNWIYGPPFRALIQPTEILQGKVLPYTLIYAPPGEKSSHFFQVSQTTTTSYGFTTTLSGGTSAGTQYSDENDLGGSTFGSIPTLPISLPTYGQTNGSTWSQGSTALQSNSVASNTSYSDGRVTTGSLSVNEAYTAATDPVPSTALSYYLTEPFWRDRFYLLVHPKFNVYNLSHCSSGIMPPCNDGQGVTTSILTSLIGADAVPSPQNVFSLYQCLAPGGSLSLPPEPQFDSNGNPILGSNGQQVFVSDSMSPYDCWNVLQTDPLFSGVGQSSLVAAPKVSPVNLYPSTLPPGSGFLPPGPGFNGSESYTLSNGVITGWSGFLSNTQTYQLTVQDAATNSFVQKVGFPYGIGSWGQSVVTGQVNGVTVGTAYGSSTNSSTSTLQNVSVTFRDDDNSYYANSFDDQNPDPSVIQMWTDNTYGTYLFRMPYAAAGPIAGRFPPPTLSSVTLNSDGSYTITGQNLFAAVSVTFSWIGMISLPFPHLGPQFAVLSPESPVTNNTTFTASAPASPLRAVRKSVFVTTPNGVSPAITIF